MKRHLRKMMSLIFGAGGLLAGCGGGSSSPPIGVSIAPLSSQFVDQNQAVSVTAVVSNDASNQGVTWSLSCSAASCGKISSLSGTTATYTAPNPVTASLLVTLLAKSAKDPTKQATASLTVVTAPSVTTTSLPGATGGISYNATLQETGGVPPFTWTISAGNLPPGLGLTSDGAISGKPTAGGESQFTVQVGDSGNPPLTAAANLTVDVVILPLTISTNSLPNATVDETYKQPILVTGGIPPYTWSVTSGNISSWATLNSPTGTITGIPDVTGTANFTLQVVDAEASPMSASTPLSLTTVAGALAGNSELNGHYAFLFSGFDDATGSPLAMAGSFIADGKGKITAGIEDENGPSGPALNVAFSGTYNIDSDHRGAFTIYTPGGTRTFAVALNSIMSGLAQQGRFAEFDDTTGGNGRRGSGLLRAQDTTAFSLGKITGPYAFGLGGQDPSGNSEAIAGSFGADGTGMIPSGIADQTVAGVANNPLLTGNYSTPSALSGRMTLGLSLSGVANINFAAYVISATDMFVVTTDPFSAKALLSGEVESQSASSFDSSALNGTAVYYLHGVNVGTNPEQSTAEIGILRWDGNGNLTSEYDYQIGNGIAKDQSAAATYSVVPSGRGTINGWHGQSDAPTQVVYLVAKNKAFFLDIPHAGLGFVEPQAAAASGSFSNGSLTGTLSAATLSPTASGCVNATGVVTLDGVGSFTETTSASTTSGLFVDQSTSGTYSIATVGRGTVTSLSVTSAGFSVSAIMFAILIALLAGEKRGWRHTSRPTSAAFCCLVLLATTPESCGPQITNQLVVYMISPDKVVMIHEQSTSHAPEITIIER